MLQMVEKYVLTYIQEHPEVMERIIKALLDRLMAELMERLPAAK